MKVYYIWGPHGKETFNLTGRLEEIVAGLNPHPHHNNGSNHGGHGGPNISGTYAAAHLEKEGYAVYSLPPGGHGYYKEYVWNTSNLPAGTTRIILGTNGEKYLTTDHYHVYYKIFEAEGGTHIRF